MGVAAPAARAVAGLLCALVVAGCTRVDAGGARAGGRHPWTIPGTLRVASSNVPRTLNPLLATQTVEAALGRLTTDILVSADASGQLVPRLAREVPTPANGGISRDGRTIVYHLRRGVRWQDGVPFTSADVKFTVGAIMNPANDVISRHGYDQIARVDTPDPLTVVFHLRQPFAPFVGTVFAESDSPYAVLPAHLLARYPNLNEVPYNSAPVGTGPYRFERWVRGVEIDFVRNDDYFLGRPKIERIVWRLVQDENTEVTLLRTHEIDWMFEVTEGAYATVRRLPDTSIALAPVNGYNGVMMNCARGPTADVRVRRAVVQALDKDRLTRDLTFGVGVVATGDLPPFMWAHDPAVRNLGYDPAAARRTLAALGYGPQRPLHLDFVYEESGATGRALVVQIQQALRAVWIDTEPRGQLSSTIYAGPAAGGTLATGHYDLAIYAWTAGIDPDDSAQFTCANRSPHGYNQSFYCSATMDAAQRVALGSYAIPVRKPAYARIEATLVADAPLDFLWWQRNVQATNPDLHGFDPNPVVETWDIAHWSI